MDLSKGILDLEEKGERMFNQIQMIVGIAVFSLFITMGFYTKSLYDYKVTNEAENAQREAIYKRDKANYERDIKSVVTFYDQKQKEVKTFKRRSNESDCDASVRFFRSRSY